jgi:hypothetical protein
MKSIADTKITSQGVAQLKAALPSAKIDWYDPNPNPDAAP